MSSSKSVLLGAGVVAVVVGLFGTGVIKLGGSGTPAVQSASQAQSEAESGAERGDRRHRRGRRGKRGRRRRGSDLESLAYLGEIPLTDETRGKSGVQVDEPGAYGGLLLANAAGGGNTRRSRRNRTIREAGLWDASGKELHRWTSELPSRYRSWAITRMDAEGFLYALVADTALVKLDWDSNIVWVAQGRFHHDFIETPDGSLAVLGERRLEVPLPNPDGSPSSTQVRLLDHGVIFLSKDGTHRNQIWLYESFKDDPLFRSRMIRGFDAKRHRVTVEEGGAERRGGLDVFHANSIVVLPREVEGLGKQGDLLLSFRHMSTVACVSRTTGEVLWSWGSDDLIRQHDATLTADGEVVLFDNRVRREHSRVVVVDPKTREISREIGGRTAQGALRFFSSGRGLAGELPNGNVFVVVSNEGRAFEVGPDDRVVWEFWSPWTDQRTRRPIRAVRLEGSVQQGVAKIVADEAEPPRRPPGAATVSTRIEFGGIDSADEPG